MARFSFSARPFEVATLQQGLADATCGGYASFEGWVRNHNEGLPVTRLEYEAFVELAVREGERIIDEARAKFGVENAACVHRVGDLAIGDLAVWVGVSARHRDEAFRACRYIIDEVKHRVPIWKKEHYVNGDSGWVNCERCATAPSAQAEAAAAEAAAAQLQVAEKHDLDVGAVEMCELELVSAVAPDALEEDRAREAREYERVERAVKTHGSGQVGPEHGHVRLQRVEREEDDRGVAVQHVGDGGHEFVLRAQPVVPQR